MPVYHTFLHNCPSPCLPIKSLIQALLQYYYDAFSLFILTFQDNVKIRPPYSQTLVPKALPTALNFSSLIYLQHVIPPRFFALPFKITLRLGLQSQILGVDWHVLMLDLEPHAICCPSCVQFEVHFLHKRHLIDINSSHTCINGRPNSLGQIHYSTYIIHNRYSSCVDANWKVYTSLAYNLCTRELGSNILPHTANPGIILASTLS